MLQHTGCFVTNDLGTGLILMTYEVKPNDRNNPPPTSSVIFSSVFLESPRDGKFNNLSSIHIFITLFQYFFNNLTMSCKSNYFQCMHNHQKLQVLQLMIWLKSTSKAEIHIISFSLKVNSKFYYKKCKKHISRILNSRSVKKFGDTAIYDLICREQPKNL